jgi:glycosyltransferase involved in cell wall biosynthesis
LLSEKLAVLHINKFHHIIGGAEKVYFTTAEILQMHGHTSIFFSMRHPNNKPCKTEEYFMPYIDITNNRSAAGFLLAIGRNMYSFKARKLVSRLLDKYHVDIVHVHNIHRQMSPSILYEFKKRGIPVVMTLHEYKTICPSYIMVANNRPCEACAQGKYSSAVKLRCVKGSFLRSALVSVEMYLHHAILDIYNNVDIFIAPSMFMKSKHEEMGFKKKIVHLPYPLGLREYERFLSHVVTEKDERNISIVYYGRIVPDKGLYTLIDALSILMRHNLMKNLRVKIIGDGPIKKELRNKVRNERIDNVRFIDFLNEEELLDELVNNHAVILPSEWYENYPVSVMEAFSLGIPVIGARIGGIPEMVKDGETGLTFESGNPVDLAEKITYLIKNPRKFAEYEKNTRLFVEQELSPERHYPKLMEIYRKVISYKSEVSH